jgi:hypothetical protein
LFHQSDVLNRIADIEANLDMLAAAKSWEKGQPRWVRRGPA